MLGSIGLGFALPSTELEFIAAELCQLGRIEPGARNPIA
jgi:hypothetical protein